ncbi:transposase [Streptomyces sp. NPDC013012]|uniref:transposase n=1 Tax=Streptomyces sp. NPDC013012 TaxID=3364860 RepID=UPI0036A8221D
MSRTAGRFRRVEPRATARAHVVEHLGADDGVLIVDEIGFLKKGRGSAGVRRRCTGTAGRIENSRIGGSSSVPPTTGGP